MFRAQHSGYCNKKNMLENQRKWLLLILLAMLHLSEALRCRSEDGPSEADMKRVIRSCMRKIGENQHGNGDGGSSSNNGFQSASNTNFHYGQNGYHYNNNNNNNNHYGQQNNFRVDSGYDSDERGTDENDSDYGDIMAGFYHDRNNGGRDIFQQRNRERNSIFNNRNNGNSNGNSNNRNAAGNGRSSSSNYNNNNNNNNHNNNSGNNGNNPRNSNSKSHNNHNSNNNNNGNSRDGGGGGGGSSSRDVNGSGSTGGNSRNFNNQNNDNNRNNGSTHDTNCVVHCFFDEMNMLNRDDYPDKHKVHYLLTKDMRDRELRNFYADTIQSCFRYMETQRRRDKCQFSRDLIQCMAEYAKANCDDWHEFNVMFN